MKNLVFSVAFVFSGFTAFSATYYWVGPDTGGTYTDYSNWADENGVQPTQFEGHVLVFTNETPIAIKNTSGNGSSKAAKEIRVTGSDVTLMANGHDFYLIGRSSPTFYVAEGAKFCCSNDFTVYYGSQNFFKKGKGTMELAGSLDSAGAAKTFTVEEGRFVVASRADLAQPTVNVRSLTVKAGATLAFRGGAIVKNTKGNVPVLIEEGGKIELEEADSTVTLNGISGSGDIVGLEGEASFLQLASVAGFSGSISGDLYLGTPAGSENVITIDDTDWDADILGIFSPDGFTFAAGITDFSLRCINGSEGGTINLEDEDGNPVRLTTKIVSGSYLTVDGPGDLTVTNSVVFLASKYKSTGVLAVDGTGTLTLGNKTVGNDFTSAGTPREIRHGDGTTVVFKPGESHEVPIPVVGNGIVKIEGAYGTAARRVCFRDLRNRAGSDGPLEGFRTEDSYCAWELAGGNAVLPASTPGRGGNAHFNVISGGRWHTSGRYSSADTMRSLTEPQGITVHGANGWNNLLVTGGELFTELGSGCKGLHVRGGIAWVESGAVLATSDIAVKNGPSQLLLDGGSVLVPCRRNSEQVTLLSGLYTDRTRFYVGSNGGRIRAVDERTVTQASLVCDIPVEPATNTVTSGLFDVEHSGNVFFSEPMTLNGPVRFSDGVFYVHSLMVDEDSANFTGTGMLTLRNATLALSDGDNFVDASLPGGLTFDGGALVTLSYSNRISAASLSPVGPGSVLLAYTSDTSLPFGEENGPRFTVDDLADNAVTGALALPVYVATGDSQRFIEFAKYDTVKGIVPFDGYKTSFSDVDPTSLVKLSASASIAENSTVHVGGICFTHTSWRNITVGNGAVLRVGNGSDPAAIHLNVCGGLSGSSGTVDFAGSEGIITVPTSHQGDPNGIYVKLTGQKGVSYFCFNRSHDQKVAVYNRNAYTGGTRIWGVDLYARNAGAFSSGEVIVGRGRCRGGRVILDSADAVFGNVFRIAGRGNSHATESSNKGRLYINQRKGALSFAKNATVTGGVVLEEAARVTAADGVTGVIEGVVSGDRLEIYKPFTDYDAGVVKLAAANTYTGGTDIVRSTLALADGSGAGTGPVELDNGVLQFDNPSAVAFTNDIVGVGAVRLTGAGVEFTGDLSRLSGSLELSGGEKYEFTEFPGFSSVTNIGTRRTEVCLKSPGVYDLSDKTFGGKIRLVLEDGAQIDLAGGTLDVYQFVGNLSAVNGTVAQERPYHDGTVIIVR